MSGTAEYSRHRDHALCGDIFMKTWNQRRTALVELQPSAGTGLAKYIFLEHCSVPSWRRTVIQVCPAHLYRNWAVTLQSVVCTLSKLYLDLEEDTEKKEENTEAGRWGGRIEKTAEGRVVLTSESPHALFNLSFYWKFLSFMRYFKTALGH